MLKLKAPKRNSARPLAAGGGATGVKVAAKRSPRATRGPAGQTTLILDLTDLFLFLKDHAHLTGIQRVEVGIAFNLLTGSIDLSRIGASRERLVFACYDTGRGRLVAVSPRDLVGLVDDIQTKSLERGLINRRLNQMLDGADEVQAQAGDLYVILGAYWFGAQYFQLLRQVRARGCRMGVVIYDLIALSHPQFVDEGTRRDLVEQLTDVLNLSDFIIAISEYVAGDVRRVLRDEMQTEKPVFAVPMSHELPPVKEGVEVSPIDALPSEYVLCVGTIEGRKNHQFLLNAWESLYRKLGRATPSLVIVGKWGWQVDDFRRQLEATEYLDGHVVILEGVSERALRDLYENCLFTVFPSFAEGWGLPVGESLACGKPCLTSNATSLPEVGGDFCRYFDPYDFAAGAAQIERLVIDREDLRGWTERVRDNFVVRTWADVAGIFFDRLIGIAEALPDEPATGDLARLTAGRVNLLSSETLAEASWRDRSVKFAFSSGWWPLEGWGCWASRPLATLSFEAIGAEPGSVATVWLQLRLPPPPSEERIMITDGSGREKTFHIRGTNRRWVAFDTNVEAGGRIRLNLRRLGPPPVTIERRALYFGLSGIAFHAKYDVDARLDLMETIATLPKSPA